MPIEQLGPYRIERLLGRGGMGAVYAGVHQETGQRAAIKVLAETLAADGRFRQRFQGEVEALKRLRHKNIVTLQGYGEEEGLLYFVMDLADGPSLDAELRSGRRFTWREVVDIGVQVCGALKHAHDHGVIHRDLKPANLLLLPDGTVKLTDFGIAKFFGGSSLTMAGSMIGTPDYMSPEQIEGKPATARSDLYSLGCVLYALLSGKPPFAGGSVTAVIDRVRTETPRPLQLAAPQTPQELDDIVAHLLKKNPEERVATPQLLANLLQAMRHALLLQEEAAAKSAAALEAGEGTTIVGDVEDLPDPKTAGAAKPPHAEGTLTENSAAAPKRPTELAPQAADASLNETVEYTLEEQSVAESAAERKTHFTPVSERDWRSVLEKVGDEDAAPKQRLGIALLGIALLAVVALIVYLALPPSADQLYRRIRQTSSQPDQDDACLQSAAEFLKRFPHDARAAEVAALQADLQCRYLRDELGHKVRALTDLEQAYLNGMRAADERRWSEAAKGFQQVVEGLEPKVLSAADRRLLDRARHMLDKALSNSASAGDSD
ncbi:MAG: serine/threonine protein kinase [Candidatus Anammoximicrobium sp.]|nr:serine/threonine protein kinase [Candidatus Anammoximicrobium sp.]